MPIFSPSSSGSFRPRLSTFDVFWAAVSPLLTLYIRDAYILHIPFDSLVLNYCSISFVCSCLAFLAFRVSDSIPRYFSVQDAFNIVKAAITSALLTSVVIFSLTRLEGIPRSTPILQFLILVAGLLAARTVTMLRNHDERADRECPEQSSAEHIIIIGTNQLSSLYIKLIHAYSPLQRRVIAALDHKRLFVGRSLCGVPVVASPQQLESVIEEFEVHGVRTDRVIIGGDVNFLPDEVLNHVRNICGQRAIVLDFLPSVIGLNDPPAPRPVMANLAALPHDYVVTVPGYFRIKRLIDFALALVAILLLAPLFVIAPLLILLELGSPVLFWQQRVGQGHRSFHLYKFRTLRPPFDESGRPIPASQRLSTVGQRLRNVRIDELPQLFNVLVGDMSLIGPRPLLSHDQPKNVNIRLSVRPGITGWAQINGGNLITTEEKGALDEWYIRHASLWLDLRIALRTLRFLFTGETRSQQAVDNAYSARHAANQQNVVSYGSEVHDAPFVANENLAVIKIAARSAREPVVSD